jgi:chromosome partitioning protein
MAKVIAVSNQKGGVGKTTTCYSLGASLVELGYHVLVVDLDPQANLTLAAGLDYDELEKTLVDLLDGGADGSGSTQTGEAKVAAPIPTSLEKLDILPSDPRLARVERDLYEEADYETRLARVIEPMTSHYDYIILDCPPTLSSLTLIALYAADAVLIPVQCEYYAAKGLDLLLTIISTMEKRRDHAIPWHLVVTLFDPRNKIHRTVYEQLKYNFSEHLLETFIRMDTKLRECPIVGEPITVYAPATRASKQYRQLAHEVDQRVKKEIV